MCLQGEPRFAFFVWAVALQRAANRTSTKVACMFDFVRTHSRLMLGLMVLLIFPSFVFFGVQGYSQFMDEAASGVATVDGRNITRAEWDSSFQRNVERLRRQYPNVDVKMFDTPQSRRDSLDGMVRERVLLAQAERAHLMPSNERLNRLFDSDPQLAAMRGPDGKISRDALAAQGMTPEMFDQQLRRDIGMRQVLGGVATTAFAPAAAASASLGAYLQRREVQFQRFDSAQFVSKVTPSDADIETFYKSHERDFQAPEHASIEYVVLDLEALGKGVVIAEADLRKYYEENISRWAVAEERRASHILVKAEKDASASDKTKAKVRAQELLAELRKAPETFADVARKSSQDTGSAAQGGDLDFFGRNAMTKPFEDAVFAMKDGEISEVVETDFGFHIIQLTAVRGGDKKPFETVRAEIEAQVRKSQAQKLFAEKAESFTNTVYEQADSLQPVMDKLKLDKRVATVQRSVAPGAQGALASQKLLDAIFGAEVVRNKRNTDAVEVAPNQMAAARIVQHTPTRVLALAEVKEAVRARVVAVQAAAMAAKEGQARLVALQKAPDEALPNALTVSRAQAQGLPRALVDAVLREPAGKLPAVFGVPLDNEGFVVVKLVRVLPRDVAPGGDATFQKQYAQAWGEAESQAYLAALKKRFKVEVQPNALAAATAASAAR